MLYGGLLAAAAQTVLALAMMIYGWVQSGTLGQGVGATETTLLIYGVAGLPVAILVGVETRARTVRVNITLAEDALREIDRYADTHGYTRSGFLARAAKDAMKAA